MPDTLVPQDNSPASQPEAPSKPALVRPASRWDEIPSGTLFAGRYRIERLIARGGMSGVYLASQLPLNRQVALKVLVPIVEDAEGEASFQERFRLEARTLASLTHPNIVVLFDYGETEDGRFFLAMEYVEGPRLSDVLKENGRLPLQRALRIALELCAALRYAHSRGVVHRDIKLSNIMLGRNQDGLEYVKVVDFGLVKLTEDDQRLTSAGMVLGSPHFIAPEQARGHNVDLRADIYAVGITLFCMVAGKPPFSGSTATATILAHLTEPIPTLASIGGANLDLPPGIEAIIQRCLAKRADDRYPDMNHLIADLGALTDGSLPGTLRADGPSSSTLIAFSTGKLPEQQGPTRSKPWLTFGALGLVIVGGLLALGVLGIARFIVTNHAQSPQAEPVEVAPAAVPPEPVAPKASAPAAPPAVAPAVPQVAAPVAPPAPVTATRPRVNISRPPEATSTTSAALAPVSPTPTAAPTATAAPSPAPAPPKTQTSDLKNPWDN